LVIAFDTLLLSTRYRHSGIHEYAKNLFREFRALLTGRESLSFQHFVQSGYTDPSLELHSTPGCKAIDTSLLRFRRLWQLGFGSMRASAAGADLVFAPGPAILPSPMIPVVVTIHDAMPARLPSTLIPKSSVAKASAWAAANLSRKVITDSENSKRDLMEMYRLPPEKVAVVYLGYDRENFNALPPLPKRQLQLFAAHGIRGSYILHHGMVQHRKNIVRLIQAYRMVRGKNGFRDVQLVLAGGFGCGSDEIRNEARRHLTDDQVVFTGPLPVEGLAILVKSATLCVIPSLYEGFCLPLSEAMASGVPTIASNSSCIPEISAGKLRYFDPFSIEQMAEEIERALTDTELRTTLRTEGLERASVFSWQRCAQETLRVLQQAAFD
jgi:glycosyltransferase involved in cell wall biosynthesis